MNAFSSANLAAVAYAEVDGPTGASTANNSGIVTNRVTTGVYTLVLPTNLTQQGSRDLIFLQAKATGTQSALPASQAFLRVDDNLEATKVVYSGNYLTTRLDCSFSVLILRTVVPPPTGAPA